MKTRGLLFTALIVSILISIVLLSGCGAKNAGKTTAPADNAKQGAPSAPAPAKIVNVTLGTAQEGGGFYIIGAGVAQAANKSSNVKVSAQATAGSMENVRNVSNDTGLDFGLTSAASIETGLADKTVVPNNVSFVMTGHPSIFLIAGRADSKFKDFADLIKNGKRLGIGPAGSGFDSAMFDILEAAGVNKDDYQFSRLSQGESADALKNNQIDAAIFGGGLPTAAVSDVATSVGVKIFTLPDSVIEKMMQKVPYWTKTTVPGGSYKGQDTDVASIARYTLVIARPETKEDVVYEVTKTVLENSDVVAKVHPDGKFYNLKNALASNKYMESRGFKLHPGAVRYYKEKGILK